MVDLHFASSQGDYFTAPLLALYGMTASKSAVELQPMKLMVTFRWLRLNGARLPTKAGPPGLSTEGVQSANSASQTHASRAARLPDSRTRPTADRVVPIAARVR
jgi:hypothetical protein